MSILVLIVIAASACATAPMAAFDLKSTLDRYLSNLPDGWGLIAPSELDIQIRTAKPFVLDVSEAKEVSSNGFISGAVNIPIRSLVKNLDKLPAKDQPIVVTCSSGHRSALGMAALQLLGYSNVKSMADGLFAWKTAKLPVESGTPPQPQAGTAPTVDQDLLAALDKYLSTLPDGWNNISPSTLSNLLKTSQPFQLDLRETGEVSNTGRIAGATLIPVRTLLKNLDKLPPDKGAPIIAECGNGHRSAVGMLALNLLGYTNVRNLAGGVAAWTKAGLPISK